MRLVSADQTGGRHRFLDETVASAGFQSRRDRLLARLAAHDRGKTSCGTNAATGRNDRGQRLVTFLGGVVARAPSVAQDGRGGPNRKCQDDGENMDPAHGGRCSLEEQDQRQCAGARTRGIRARLKEPARDFARSL